MSVPAGRAVEDVPTRLEREVSNHSVVSGCSSIHSTSSSATSSLLARRASRKGLKEDLSLSSQIQDLFGTEDLASKAALEAKGYLLGGIIGRSQSRGTVVYSATSERFPYAIKFNDGAGDAAISAAELRKQYELLKSLRHPNIVEVTDFEVFSDGQRSAMVMEFCAGSPLSKLLSWEGTLNMLGRHSVLKQVLSALEYLHQQDIVFQDLRARNVMADTSACLDFRSSVKVKLSDFGRASYCQLISATEVSAAPALDQVFASILPPSSAAKQVRCDLDPSLDVFAAGLLAFGMVAGRNSRTKDAFPGGALRLPLLPEWMGQSLAEPAGSYLASLLSDGASERPTAADALAALPPDTAWLEQKRVVVSL